MSRSRTRSSKKKTVTIAVLVACLLLAAVGGTIAWMTVRDSLINEFTVGDFADPSTDPDDPTSPIHPEDGSLQGHLYEKEWVEDSKLIPGATIPKDPNVGIGEGSEDAYVYLYVRNTSENNAVYFQLNDNWKAVNATQITIDQDDPGYDITKAFYTGGLFVYVGEKDAPEKLHVGDNKTVWTGELFSNVYVDNDAKIEDLTGDDQSPCKIEVTALLHQATSGDNSTNLLNTANAWAEDQVKILSAGIAQEASDSGVIASDSTD